MATSGVFTFDLDMLEIIEEAMERIGGSISTGDQFLSARRSIDLLFRDMENQGAALWRIEDLTQAVTAGTITYTLPDKVIDIVDAVLQSTVNSVVTDYRMTPFSRSEYVSLPDKSSAGLPTKYWLEKGKAGAAVLHIWPDGTVGGTETVKFWAVVRHQDAGILANDLDLKYSFVPGLTSGLAYQLGLKKSNPELSTERLQMLKSDYTQSMRWALRSDRERARTRIVPDLGRR